MLERLARLFHRDKRRLETRLQLALKAGGMAAWEWEVPTGRRWWSSEMFVLHGRNPKDGLPDDYYDLVHPDDRERVRSVVSATVKACADHSVQYRVAWPDGSWHWLEAAGTTLCDDDGGPELMTGVCVDIDERKADENDLKFLAEASTELAALTDYPHTMQRIARLAVPNFADWCAVDMVEGDRLKRVAVAHVDESKVRLALELHERYPPEPGDPGGVWNVVRTGRPELVPVITPEMLAGVKDPEFREHLLALGLHSYMAVPVVAHGTVLGAITFITSESRRVFSQRDLVRAADLAARAAVAIENAELVEALRRSDAAKDTFLATLAHELRNPLAPIVNSIALLERAADPARMLPQALGVMRRQTAHLTRLVDDLLDVARINSGKFELRRELVDLRDVVRAAVESSQPLIDRCHHTLAVELPGAPVPVRGDPVRLAQVVANLLNNAAKYTPEPGRIVLAMTLHESHVEIEVSDTGPGIPPELLPRMFELFTQGAGAAPARNGDQHGLGIGLFLVKSLAEMHGGRVSAESGGAGTGTRFVVSLPLSEEAATQAAPVEGGAATAPAKKVLVVDDNVDAAETLAQLLGFLNHEPRTAHDGASALEAYEEFGPDVVLLDIGLPDIDGYEVARRIRSKGDGADVRLVALTGWGQKEDKRMAAEAGFDDHWTKPLDPAKLESL
ncbi:ATP-binding protein [Ramlibacter albus]|uniref:histidine kinase n=1 Tax=Ramlibacter albus TaxID=2079448 RepID=A0A923MCX3_9BURK|nr:ATP-binding protein [Ramlibacter albus]MBC5767009.1 response regulator [Ramlibacter albus]